MNEDTIRTSNKPIKVNPYATDLVLTYMNVLSTECTSLPL